MKWFMTTSSDSPTASASPESSASKSVLATMPERQAHQVFVRIADLALVPGLEHPLGVLDHDRGVALDLLVLERRLGQLALPTPEGALAGQESLARPAGISHRVSLSFMKLSAWVRRT